ncbi:MULTISPECIES: hypothetical protein [Sorangium]|uniref:hypothetical protein n=1 Tax=Sorangium TaxID=39643 RepID=UPI0012FF85CA|nr:hypothetical protein [Sorangium cellulosum]
MQPGVVGAVLEDDAHVLADRLDAIGVEQRERRLGNLAREGVAQSVRISWLSVTVQRLRTGESCRWHSARPGAGTLLRRFAC